MPTPSKAQRAAFAASRAAAVEEMSSRLGDMTPAPGQVAVTIRIDRPDGQFTTSTRLLPDDLIAEGPYAGFMQDWALKDVGSAFLSAYHRAAALGE